MLSLRLVSSTSRRGSTALAGGLGGLAALGLDEVLAWATLGYLVPVSASQAGWYALVGLIGGASWAVATRSSATGRPALGLVAGLLLVYGLAAGERLAHVAGNQVSGPGLALATVTGVAGLAAAATGLARACETGLGAGGLVSLAMALGLAVHRNLIQDPFEPLAWLTGLCIGLLVGGGVIGLRSRRGLRAAIVTGSVVVAGLGVWALRTGPRPVPRSAAGDPPDLVLLVIDTLRQDVFESVLETTPEGKRFRDQLDGSIWYSRAVAASPWTAPSMASIFTGLYPREHGFWPGNLAGGGRYRSLTETAPTLAQELRRHGYYTYALVTNPLLHRDSGLLRGFADHRLLLGPTVKLPLLTALERFGAIEPDYYQGAARVRGRLSRDLERLAGLDRPLFLWLHLMEPHEPLRRHPELPSAAGEDGLPDPERRYRREVRSALAESSRMFDSLHAAGRWQGAAVVVVSDHGEMFPSDGHDSGARDPRHGRPILQGHGHALFEELMRVPLVIRPPQSETGHRTVDQLMSHVDLLPALAELLDLDLGSWRSEPGGVTASGRPEPGVVPAARRAALLSGVQHRLQQIGWRTDRYKLIHYPRGERPDELYDLSSDPGEQEDLAAREAALASRLRAEMKASWEALSPLERRGPTASETETRARLRALGYVP